MQYGWWCHRPPMRASISLNGPMSSPAAHTQWYIARNGQQYGPLSEAELGRFVELGHLQPTDLLWREGFPDWRPAMVVFPPRASTLGRQGPPARPQGAAASRSPARPSRMRGGQGARESYHAPEAAPRRRGLRRTLIATLCIFLLAGGAWYASTRSETLLK